MDAPPRLEAFDKMAEHVDQIAESLGSRMDTQSQRLENHADAQIELDRTVRGLANIVYRLMPQDMKDMGEVRKILRRSYETASFVDDGEDVVKIEYREFEDLLRFVGAIGKDETFPPTQDDDQD